jgi:hypothetical protein
VFADDVAVHSCAYQAHLPPYTVGAPGLLSTVIMVAQWQHGVGTASVMTVMNLTQRTTQPLLP